MKEAASNVVMAGHSRSKNGVASLAFLPAIHVFLFGTKDVDARHKAGHDGGETGASKMESAQVRAALCLDDGVERLLRVFFRSPPPVDALSGTFAPG